MNLSSLVVLLQLVLSLLSSNPSPSNQALAMQAVNLATESLSVKVENNPTVVHPMMNQLPVNPIIENPPINNPSYIPPTEAQNVIIVPVIATSSPVLGSVVSSTPTSTPDIVIRYECIDQQHFAVFKSNPTCSDVTTSFPPYVLETEYQRADGTTYWK